MSFLKPTTAEPQTTSDSSNATLRAEVSWLKVGEHPFWKLARMELAVKKLRIRRANGVNSLFSAAEISTRQNQAFQGFLDNNEARSDVQRKTSPIASLYRFLSRKLHSLSRKSDEPSGSDPLSKQQARREKLAVAAASPIHLFSPDDVNARLRPILIQLERRFRRQMAATAKTFDEYQNWTERLPKDDIDNAISTLRHRYAQISRQREWYVAYKLMVERAVKESKLSATRDGSNEPMVRILQQDFLQTMESRFASYWRLHELRAYCYKHAFVDEITMIERQNGNLSESDALLRPPTEFSAVTELVDELEGNIQHNLKATSINQRAATADQHVKIDQDARREEWQAFKDLLEQKFTPINTLLSKLKAVVKHNKGWQLEFQIFRSLTRVKRIEQKHRGKSPDYRLEALKFARELSLRIDNEIDTDIRFQLIREAHQNLANSQLKATMNLMQIEMSQRGVGALNDIHQIKQKCVAEHENAKLHKVVPLYSRK